MKVATPPARCPFCSSRHVTWVHHLFSWHLSCHYCKAQSKRYRIPEDAYRHWQLLAAQVDIGRRANIKNLPLQTPTIQQAKPKPFPDSKIALSA